MEFKWIGALLIVASCGGFGFSLSFACRKEEQELRQLAAALDYMGCELQYRLTPLPDLCRQAGLQSTGILRKCLLSLAEQLECQISGDVSGCMEAALAACQAPPGKMREQLRILGHSLGRFDLEGQLKGIAAVRENCRNCLQSLNEGKENRLRSYQTLGVCAGAALVILFI